MTQVLKVWPSDSSGLLLWAHIVLGWQIANYLLWHDLPNPPRSRRSTEQEVEKGWSFGSHQIHSCLRALMLGFVILLIAGCGTRQIWLSITAVTLTLILTLARQHFANRYRLAEWEIGINVLFLALISIQVAAGSGTMHLAFIWVSVPVPDRHVAAYLCVGAAAVFLGRGGTFVVRGFLEQAGTLPEYTEEDKSRAVDVDIHLRYDRVNDRWHLGGLASPISTRKDEEEKKQRGQEHRVPGDTPERVDQFEVRRGRLIGNIERLLLLVLALSGSYPAVAFLMAAKGIVRAKEFEKRNYAEYFLIGTLASTALALVLGTLLRVGFHDVWPAQ